MSLKLDINGINAELEISRYRPAKKRFGHLCWCDCKLSVVSEDFLNYQLDGREAFYSLEIDLLEAELTKLLNGQITETTEFICNEPDFEFYLHPQKETLRPDYVFDIFVEWKINFWHEHGPSGNFLTLTLWREDITAFRDYLRSVINGGQS